MAFRCCSCSRSWAASAATSACAASLWACSVVCSAPAQVSGCLCAEGLQQLFIPADLTMYQFQAHLQLFHFGSCILQLLPQGARLRVEVSLPLLRQRIQLLLAALWGY